LPQVGNATPSLPPSIGFSVKLAVAKPPTEEEEGGRRGLTLLWQSGFYAID